MKFNNPLIMQRADPHISRHNGYYYFTASVPEYDRVILRHARTLVKLAHAEEITVWRAPENGPASALIWAPELHHGGDAWYLYFAAAPSREIKDHLFQHRMYALRNPSLAPMQGEWNFAGQVDSGLDTFCLDATSFEHCGQHYYLWAQKHPEIPGNSNLYLAKMQTPTRIMDTPVMLSRPEFDWETQGYAVNEGPAVLIRHGKIFVTYSASATDERYAVGLLWINADADLMDAANWHKSPIPVFSSDAEHHVFGPGHNSFTTSEDGKTDMIVYHARNDREIEGDPLWNPDRHTCIQPLHWDDAGTPVFGRPLRDVEITGETR